MEELLLMKGYKPKYLRQKNYRNLLKLYMAGDVLSVSEILQHMELSKTTINHMLSKLTAAGILKNMGKGSSTSEGGKRPLLYGMNEKHGYGIAVMADRTGCTIRMLDFQLHTLIREEFAMEEHLSYEERIRRTAEEIWGILKRMKTAPEQIFGIAYHCAGIVDSKSGTVLRSMDGRLPDHAEIKKDLLEALGFEAPVLVENSARCAANYECIGRREVLKGTVMTVNIAAAPDGSKETGIGGCLLLDGRISSDHGRYLSELGHTIVDVDSGIRCKCGNYGCLESFIDGKNLSFMVSELMAKYPDTAVLPAQSPISLHGILAYAKEGDALALEIANRIASIFAALMHNLILGYDPDEIVIQGEEDGGLMEYFADKIREQFRRQSFFGKERDLLIRYVPGKFEEKANVGAGAFCRDSYLETLLAGIAGEEIGKAH